VAASLCCQTLPYEYKYHASCYCPALSTGSLQIGTACSCSTIEGPQHDAAKGAIGAEERTFLADVREHFMLGEDAMTNSLLTIS
jgi:hypothetical protein